MNKWIRAFCAAGLLALSGNAAAIMIDDRVYGISGYSLTDIDHAIQAYEDQTFAGTNGNHRKPQHNFDQKIKLLYKLDEYIENLSYAMHQWSGRR